MQFFELQFRVTYICRWDRARRCPTIKETPVAAVFSYRFRWGFGRSCSASAAEPSAVVAGGGGGAAHSMTSSARARIEGGIVRPSALAVLRLTTSSKMVGCWTGRSAGLAP